VTSLADLPTPALLLDLDALEGNLRAMADRAARLGVALRPHVKTHKCIEIGRLQAAAGARGITVATLEEARVFADAGFTDVLWAFPVVLGRIAEAARLDQSIQRRASSGGLSVVLDSPEALEVLEGSGHPFAVWLKVDCGYHRAGVDPRAPGGFARARKLVERLLRSPVLELAGILTHSGHAYHERGRAARARVAEEERSVMVELAERLRESGLPVPSVSVGSTPAMTAVESLEGVDETRPGNYALFDATQVALGSCDIEECAATVLATVVSSQPGAGHCVVDAGALALSKDSGFGDHGMGEILSGHEPGRLQPEARLTSLSQEHGKVSVTFPVGSRLRILPNHSCLTVACFDEFVVVRGETVLDRWAIHRGR
jgi:D-serine deaminase-like pyridoxal phosphate-dependent protein